MDILILNWKDIYNPDVGGAEIILYELTKRLIRDKHSVTWFSRSYFGCKEVDEADGIKIIRRGNRFSVYQEAKRYYSSLDIKPDKVLDCINTICWQTPLYVPKTKRVAYINQLAKEVLFYELPLGISHLAYFLEPLQYKTYSDTNFICYSESVKEDIAGFGIPPKKISLFPLGIDHARYVPGKNKTNHPLFVFVARLVSMKRADLCIRAMTLVLQKYPTAELCIIGYGPQKDEIQKLIDKVHFNNNIKIIDKNNLYMSQNIHDVKVLYMQKAWALLLPSVKEGWGMVVTEAAACGTPSIVTKVSGLIDSVIKDKTGYVISSRPTIGELAQTMIRCIENTKERKKMSKNAIIFSKQFNWDNSYKIFFKLLTS